MNNAITDISSYCGTGDEWAVAFRTQGTADLIIIRNITGAEGAANNSYFNASQFELRIENRTADYYYIAEIR